MLKPISIVLALSLTACVASDSATTAASSGTTTTTTSGGTTVTPTTADQLQSHTWHRVGQYCGTVYTTGLAVLHATFTTTQMKIGMTFNCDNAVHDAQIYDARYDHDTVQVEMSSAATSSCPMVYTSSGSPGWETYTAKILNDNGNLALELTVGTCGNNAAKKDVYWQD